MFSFNPRSREGSDDILPNVWLGVSVVSIHAPVKGATMDSSHVNERNMFQSTLP